MGLGILEHTIITAAVAKSHDRLLADFLGDGQRAVGIAQFERQGRSGGHAGNPRAVGGFQPDGIGGLQGNGGRTNGHEREGRMHGHK